MPQKTQVFEKEEAEKLLDYFVAYKKLQNKLDHIKCVAALNPFPNLNENQMHTQPTSLLNQTKANFAEPAIGLPQDLKK